MITEEKINKLNELLLSIKSDGKRNYILSIINDFITDYNVIENQLTTLKAKRIAIPHNKYQTLVEKIVNLLELLGFSLIEIQALDSEIIEFLKINRLKITKPLDKNYFYTLVDLYRYCEFAQGIKPRNLTDLKNAYTEIENNKD